MPKICAIFSKQNAIFSPRMTPMKSSPAPKAKFFNARLERSGDRLNWVIIRIPFDVHKLWGKRGQLRVKGEINGFAFRTSLFPTGSGHHKMMVNKEMQAGGHVQAGMSAKIGLTPDQEKPKPAVPAELARFLAEDRLLRCWYDGLNTSTRSEVGKFILQAKKPAVRLRRAEQMAERLLAVRDAELELPPILKAPFARDPLALAGWQRMTLTQRRGHLFGIFYYRTPESRDRRVVKAIEDALAVAKRKMRPQKQPRNAI
jgi:uncharacterized protein YdeI (YjbR/CyaY-like superfamily)